MMEGDGFPLPGATCFKALLIRLETNHSVVDIHPCCRIMRVINFTESEREEPSGGGACAGLQVDTGHLEISQME
jgi:hypothetical protein